MQDSERINLTSPANERSSGAYWTPERVAVVSRNVLLITIGGIIAGLFAVNAQLYYVALVIGGAVLALLVAWQYEAVLTVYILVAFVPWGQTPGIAVGGSGMSKGIFVSEAMLGFMIVVWAGKYLLRSLPVPRPPTGFYKAAGLYLAYCVINVVNSFIFWDASVDRIYQKPAVNAIDLGMRFLSVGALLLMATTIRNKVWLRRVTIGLFLAATYNTLNAMTGQFIPFQAPWWPFFTMLPACYCCLLALDNNLPTNKRVLAGAFVAACVFVVAWLNIGWVSGWLALLTSLAVVLVIKNRKLFVIAAVALGIFVIAAWPVLQVKVIKESKEGGDYDRFSLMAGAVKYATTFPLGVGLGNYRTYNTYHYGEKWGTKSYTSAHGTYSQALSETGFPGLIMFGAMLLGGFAWLVRGYHSLPEGYSKTFLLVAIGQMAGIGAAALVGDYIIPSYHNGGLGTFSTTVYSWLIWGLAIAHVRISGKQTDGSVGIDS